MRSPVVLYMKSRSDMIAGKGENNSRRLIKKFFDGSYPADIERRFHLWLLSEKKWDEKETALEDMWEMVPYGNPKQALGSLNTVKSKLGMPGKTVALGRRRIVLSVAAVVIPLLMIAGAGFLLFDRFVNIDSGMQAIASVEAVAGETVVLPDKSVVEITDGTLTYPAEFTADERRVFIDGSAYFMIADDHLKPFIVESPLLTVRVTGTQFMLTCDRVTGTATVSLVQGSVDVLIEGQETISLPEGPEIIYRTESGEVTLEAMPAQMADRKALTQGTLIFEDNTLEEIIRAVARSRGYGIQMNPNGLGPKRYDVKFKEGEKVDEILGVLNILTSSSFTYIIEKDRIIIE